MQEAFDLIKTILGKDIFSIWIDHVDFIDIIIRMELLDEFKQNYKDGFNWSKISMYPDLPEDFVRNNTNKINWYLLSKFQVISSPFADKFKYKIKGTWDIRKLHRQERARKIQKYKTLMDTHKSINNLKDVKYYINNYESKLTKLKKSWLKVYNKDEINYNTRKYHENKKKINLSTWGKVDNIYS